MQCCIGTTALHPISTFGFMTIELRLKALVDYLGTSHAKTSCVSSPQEIQKSCELINKFPDPPNKDVGEGLNTAFAAMEKLRLKKPEIEERDNSVVVVIAHSPLSSPEETVMEYLEGHDEITNSIGREWTASRSDISMKDVFLRSKKRSLIEPVPGKKGKASAWRKYTGTVADADDDEGGEIAESEPLSPAAELFDAPVARTPKSKPSERYNAREAEPRWQKVWDERGIFATAATTTRARNTTCWRCSPIRRGASTWATCATTRWATWSRATSAPRASTCCIRWAGTPSACRPRTPPWSARSIRKAWTYENIAAMKAQLKSMGLSLDWAREIATCDPGLLQAPAEDVPRFPRAPAWSSARSRKVNWDPVDQTVLANEQVIDGRGWRSGALVEQRELTQWFFKITDYAEELLDALDTLDRWPEKVRLMQQQLDRPLGGPAGPLRARSEDRRRPARASSKIFTTRPDTLFGAKFMAIAPDHPLAAAAAAKNPALAAFIAECKRHGTAQAIIETAEKKGFDTGIKRDPSVRSELEAAGLRRQLHPDGLRHRRDLRLPGARPARPRLRQQIRARQHAGGVPARRTIRRPSSSPTRPMTATAA